MSNIMLRKLDDANLVVESKDTRIIHMKRLAATKFLRDGDPVKASELKPGDHLIVDYRQDDEGFMTAVNVTLEKEGTPSERAHASEPVEIMEPVSDSKADDERPVQRRRDSKKDDAPAPAAQGSTPPTAATPNDAAKPPSAGAQPASAPAELPDIVPPEAGIDLDHIPTNTSSHKPVDSSDAGPPKLARGIPKPRKAKDADQIALHSAPEPAQPGVASPGAPTSVPSPAAETKPGAGVSPVAHSDGPNLTEMAPPVDAHIQKAREAAESFTESLPDYVCRQQTARFQSTTHTVNWVPVDIVTAELVYEKGRESYRNIAINGKQAKSQRMEEIPGATSTGEFGSVLEDLFSPATAADFRFRRNSKSGGRDAFLYDFAVDHDHSHWAIHAPSQSVLPAYRGSVWIDKETGRTLRIEMQTVHLPEEFPFDKIEMATDYEFIRISDRQFLLPVHSENLMCQRGTDVCSHNVIDFKNYHKFTGESTIEFGK